MAVTMPRETTEDLRAGLDEVPPVAGGRGWRAGVRHVAAGQAADSGQLSVWEWEGGKPAAGPGSS